jgi:hypothetical protein
MSCQYIITRGKNKGHVCGKKRCTQHIFNEHIQEDISPFEGDFEDKKIKEKKINTIEIILEMIEARKYHIISQNESEIKTKECTFILSGQNKVNINYIKNIIKYATEENISHLILIYKGCSKFKKSPPDIIFRSNSKILRF